MNLSEHFTYEEMTHTNSGLSNEPDENQKANLVRLCNTALEPAREILGCPFRVNSGFRSLAVNAAAGGVRTSAHLDGRACDFVPLGPTLDEAFDALRLKDLSALPYDQIIREPTWIHLGIAREGEAPRHQALRAERGEDGKMIYKRVL